MKRSKSAAFQITYGKESRALCLSCEQSLIQFSAEQIQVRVLAWSVSREMILFRALAPAR